MRKIEDERDARACLKAAKAARLSAGEWARQHGIDGRSLNAWRVNLERRGTTSRSKRARTATELGLVELVPAPAARVEGRYLVRIAGAEIELTDDFRDETLARLVRALRSC